MLEYSDDLNQEVLISRCGDRFHYVLAVDKTEIHLRTIMFTYEEDVRHCIQYRLKGTGRLFNNDVNRYDVMVLGGSDDETK